VKDQQAMSIEYNLQQIIDLYAMLAVDSLVPKGVNGAAEEGARIARELLACEQRRAELNLELELAGNNIRELLAHGR
jgi:hypothetical protein